MLPGIKKVRRGSDPLFYNAYHPVSQESTKQQMQAKTNNYTRSFMAKHMANQVGSQLIVHTRVGLNDVCVHHCHLVLLAPLLSIRTRDWQHMPRPLLNGLACALAPAPSGLQSVNVSLHATRLSVKRMTQPFTLPDRGPSLWTKGTVTRKALFPCCRQQPYYSSLNSTPALAWGVVGKFSPRTVRGHPIFSIQ